MNISFYHEVKYVKDATNALPDLKTGLFRVKSLKKRLGLIPLSSDQPYALREKLEDLRWDILSYGDMCCTSSPVSDIELSRCGKNGCKEFNLK
jgi:hypothetical protein